MEKLMKVLDVVKKCSPLDFGFNSENCGKIASRFG